MFLQNVNEKICSSFEKDPVISTLNFAFLTVYLPLWIRRFDKQYLLWWRLWVKTHWKMQKFLDAVNTFTVFTSQKMKFSIKDFFCKCDQIRSFLRIWSHLHFFHNHINIFFSILKLLTSWLAGTFAYICLFWCSEYEYLSYSMNFLFNISLLFSRWVFPFSNCKEIKSYLADWSLFRENSPSKHSLYLPFDCSHVPCKWTFFSNKKR